tara:strand:- start:173 stop:1018 length:846 start_codon:yes stop_codon:yes gene_type:complete
MTKLLNTTFDSKKATGRILTNLESISDKQDGINTSTVKNANDICQFIIHDEFTVLASSSFTAEELTKQCQSFAENCLGIPEANYSKEEFFKKSKRDSLRESMKIAQVLMAKSLYADLDETKIKRVSNQGRMMINNPNDTAGTDRFNKDADQTVRVGKSDLLSIYSTVYGNSGGGKKVSTYSKAYADLLNLLDKMIIKQPESKKNVSVSGTIFPEGITFEDIETHDIQLQAKFLEIRTAYIKGVEPVQAVKKGYINSVDEHPNNKDVKFVRNTTFNKLKKSA